MITKLQMKELGFVEKENGILVSGEFSAEFKNNTWLKVWLTIIPDVEIYGNLDEEAVKVMVKRFNE